MAGVTIRVPATIANLGPGFDSFAIALGLYDQYLVSLSDECTVSIEGEAEGLVPYDDSNRVLMGARAVVEKSGRDAKFSISCISRIPPGRGLGSSAAATVAGILSANSLLCAGLTSTEILALAWEIEGHGDNAAAALHGGFVIAYMGDDGPTAQVIDPDVGIAAIVVLGAKPLDTEIARDLLPKEVPLVAAAANVARAALLAAGISSGHADIARLGLRDFIHERYRAQAVSDLDTVQRALMTAGADGAVLAGAGPSVAGILLDVDDSVAFQRALDVAVQVSELLESIEGREKPMVLPLDRRGFAVV